MQFSQLESEVAEWIRKRATERRSIERRQNEVVGRRRRNTVVTEGIVHLIPEDTRGLTGRIMGDPLPGRSALDKYRAKVAAEWWR